MRGFASHIGGIGGSEGGMTQGRHLQADSRRHLAALGHLHLGQVEKVVSIILFLLFWRAIEIAPAHLPSCKEGVPPSENQ